MTEDMPQKAGEDDIAVPLELVQGKQRLTLLPEIGGAVGQWQKEGRDLFLPVANAALRAQKGVAVAAYPLVPYSNRITNGQFSFCGDSFQLGSNMEGTSHPVHGNGWENCWTVAHQGQSHAVLVFDHMPQGETEEEKRKDLHWPFAYRAVFSYALHEDGLEVGMVVENRDTLEQPVSFGFHPFFAAGPETRLSFDAERVWLTSEDGFTREAVPCAGEWSFHEPVTLYERAIDNAFAGFLGKALLEDPQARYSIQIEAAPVFEHLVMFRLSKGAFVTLAPVTNMIDALNCPDVACRGVHVLKPQSRTGGVMRFLLRDL